MAKMSPITSRFAPVRFDRWSTRTILFQMWLQRFAPYAVTNPSKCLFQNADSSPIFAASGASTTGK
jgi:hypothetical protein